MEPYVQLFGVAKAHLEAETIPFVSDKRFLLLAYLAYRGDWVNRDQLAFLFWPDIPTQDARKNLRHLLSRVRSLAFVQLESLDEQVRWRVPTDVAQFQQSLAQGDWAKAIEVYKGTLLKGLEPNLSDYEDWLQQEQENLQNAYRQAALNHAKHLHSEGHLEAAHALLAKVLKEDLLAEDIVQLYMQTAQQVGQRADALKAYDAFKKLLFEELGLEPLESTRQLAESLRVQPAASQVSPNSVPEVALLAEETPKLRNFPSQLTPFVGRDLDLSEIGGYLREPSIRLLTLIGPGGIGKTRLAMQVALEQAAHFRDGVTFVPLASIATADNLVPAVAGALGLGFASKQSPEDQLKDYLKNQEMLLVLDNLEHIIEGAGIISELLESSPRLKVLTTSREALDFHGEYLVEVTGMEVPPDPNLERIEIYDAVQLFVRSARRLNPRFNLEPDSKPQVAHICQMLHGAPLAIELATTWIRLLSVKEVEEEIQKSLDFLKANQPNLPERHRSMRAVFEHSWNLLNPEEQTALMRLSVFGGGFRKEAAETVGGVALRTLLTLTNKSLLQRTAEGRFDRHVMVREFSGEKLAQSPDLFAQQREKHGLYYFDFLEARPMGGPSDQQYLAEIEEELENIRTAWTWAVENKRADQLERSSDLVVFYDRRARFEGGANLFTEAVEVLDKNNPDHTAALGKVCVDSAWLYYRLGWLEKAQDYATHVTELLTGLSSSTLMKAFNILGTIGDVRGDQEQARHFFLEALKLARKNRNLRAQSNYLNNLGQLEQLAGNYQLAEDYYNEVLRLQEHNNNPFDRVMTLNNLGRLKLVVLDLGQAAEFLNEALKIARAIGYTFSIPYLLSNLGYLALKSRDYPEAQRLCHEALQIMEGGKDPAVKATVYCTLGRATTITGNFTEAMWYFRESLSIVWDMREWPIVLENIVGLAELAFSQGNFPMSRDLLELAVNHPAIEPWFKRDAYDLLGRLTGSEMSPPSSLESKSTLEQLVETVLDRSPH